MHSAAGKKKRTVTDKFGSSFNGFKVGHLLRFGKYIAAYSG